MEELKFIWHDCFVFINESHIMVFDYWTDPASSGSETPHFILEADKDKHLWVFVSHHHRDHYNKKIFEWEQFFKSVTFILSHDTAKYCRYILKPESIYTGYKPSLDNVRILKNGDSCSLDGVEIRAYGSTDIGNSYMIKTEDKTIFHAGDLNAWIWKDESTEEEVYREIKKFTDVLATIKTSFDRIDYVMFPVDARIGSEYYLGARIFVREFQVKRFFPMHFCLGENDQETMDFKRKASAVDLYANPQYGEYICLTSPYAAYLKS